MNVVQFSGLPAAIVALGFALLARGLRSLTDGGALTGAAIAFLLMWGGGLAAFVPLVAVFLLTVVATRWRSEQKSRQGLAERHGGRNARQVVANLGAAALCSVAARFFPRHAAVLMMAAMAVLAEAAADTVSSEAGQAVASEPRLILGFRRATVGTNGGVSLEGTFAGCIAASIVAWTATLVGVVSWRWAPILSFAGVAGMFFDSVLGAAFENDGRIGNDAVNFISTVFAADLALLAALVLPK